MIRHLPTRTHLYHEILPRGGRGAEIGVCRGANAITLWMATRPLELHLVDPWELVPGTVTNHPIGLHYGDWQADVARLFEGIPGVVTHRRTGADFLAALPADALDWVYLDGDHKYEPVAAELAQAVRVVRPGGIIAGHDFMVHEKAWGSGVVRAVIETIQSGAAVMAAITGEDFPSFALRRR